MSHFALLIEIAVGGSIGWIAGDWAARRLFEHRKPKEKNKMETKDKKKDFDIEEIRMRFAQQLFNGFPKMDEAGVPTGVREAPIITLEQFAKILRHFGMVLEIRDNIGPLDLSKITHSGTAAEPYALGETFKPTEEN